MNIGKQTQHARHRDVEALTRALNRARRNRDFGQRREFVRHLEKARAMLLRFLAPKKRAKR